LSAAVVIGLGNRMRGDDAIGPVVARLLAEREVEAAVAEHETEPTGLIELWDGAPLAVVVDATAPAGRPGRIERREVGEEGLPPDGRRAASTHALDLAATIELGRSLGRLPDRLVVYGIEAESFATGAPLSAPVAAALAEAADRVGAELAQAAAEPR
jgi:hydrogenase maturation protease